MKLFSFLCSFFLLTSLSAEDAIGKVITVQGKAEANQRNLSRGSSIFVSDKVGVQENSKVQIKFSDGGILNLIEKTEYVVKSYAFNPSGTNTYAGELLKGGFRAVSGSIGQINPSGYSVKTPVATIGIRGTTLEANIVNGETFFGCREGQISVRNDAGELFLNAGEYTSTASFDYLGEVTDVRPEAFSEEYFIPEEDGDMFDEEENPSESDEEEETPPMDNEDQDQQSSVSQENYDQPSTFGYGQDDNLSSFDHDSFSSDSYHDEGF